MRTFLILLLSFPFQGLAQSSSAPIVKNADIKRCGETDFYLVTLKNKTGLYNNVSQEYLLKPAESFFYYFDFYNLLFEATTAGIINVYNFELIADNISLSPVLSSSSQSKIIIHSFGTYNFENNNLLLQDGYLVRYITPDLLRSSDSTALLNKKTSTIDTDEKFFFGLEKLGNLIVLTDFHDRYMNEPLRAIRSIEYPEEDSISAQGDVLYYSRKLGHQRSGVYNLDSKNWEIPRNYKQITSFNNLFICLKDGMDTIVENEDEYYDFYVQTRSEILPTPYRNIQFNGGFPFELVFEKGTYRIDSDSSQVYFQTQSGQGIMRVQLFNAFWNSYGYQLPAISVSQLAIDTIIKPVYDFALKSGRDDPFYIAQKDSLFYVYWKSRYTDKTEIWSFAENFGEFNPEFRYSTFMFDNQVYEDTSEIETIDLYLKNERDFSLFELSKGAWKIDDSLIYIQNWQRESGATSSTPGAPVLYEGYSDDNGSNQYYYPNAGVYESGIFDKKNQRWFIEPVQAYILFAENGFMVCAPVLTDNGNLIKYTYTTKSHDNQIINYYDTYQAWLHSDEFMPFSFPALKQYSKNLIDPRLPNYYYFTDSAKSGVLDIEKNTIVIQPADFAYYDPFHNLSISITDGIIHTDSYNYSSSLKIDQSTNLTLNYFYRKSKFVWIDSSSSAVKVIEFINQEESNEYAMQGSEFQKYLTPQTQSMLQLKSIGDNVLYIQNWQNDEIIENTEMPENYLTDFKGEVKTSMVTIPGYEKSGVFDLANKKWIVKPNYRWIKRLADGNYLTYSTSAISPTNKVSVLSLIDKNGQFIFHNKTKNEVPADYRPYFH